MSHNTALDINDYYPRQMQRYLSGYGWNFSKAACRFAVGLMEDRNGERVKFTDKKEVMDKLEKYGITLKHDNGYNAVYAYNMVMADYMGSSIEDEKHACLMVKDIIDDNDNKGGNLFRKFYADCVAKGVVIDWADIFD